MTVLRDGRLVGTFRTRNLSAGGLLLDGELPLRLGEKVQVIMRLTAERSARAQAVVVREDPAGGNPRVALAFIHISTPDQDFIARAALEAFEAARNAFALIVDPSPEICDALGRQLASLGHASFAVSTPPEAIAVLGQQNCVSVGFVDLALDRGPDGDLLEILAQDHPRVRRVLMSDDILHLQAAQLVPRERRFAQGVLPKPWSRKALVRALDESPGASVP